MSESPKSDNVAKRISKLEAELESAEGLVQSCQTDLDKAESCLADANERRNKDVDLIGSNDYNVDDFREHLPAIDLAKAFVAAAEHRRESACESRDAVAAALESARAELRDAQLVEAFEERAKLTRKIVAGFKQGIRGLAELREFDETSEVGRLYFASLDGRQRQHHVEDGKNLFAVFAGFAIQFVPGVRWKLLGYYTETALKSPEAPFEAIERLLGVQSNRMLSIIRGKGMSPDLMFRPKSKIRWPSDTRKSA